MSSNPSSDLSIEGRTSSGRAGQTPPELAGIYQRAFRLLSLAPPDYHAARPLLAKCVGGDPGNLIFAETFLRVLDRVPTPRGRLKGLFQRLAFQRALDQKQWHRVAQLGPALMVLRPTDAPVLLAMAEACERLGHQDVSLRYLVAAVEAHRHDVRVQRIAAETFARLGLFDQVRECCERILRRSPHDAHASRLIRDVSTSGPPAPRMSPSAPLPQSMMDPTDVPAILDQADDLLQRGRWDAAEPLLRQAIQATPGDFRLVERLEDCMVGAARDRLEVARGRSAGSESVEAEELKDQLEQDLIRREIDVLGARCSRYPAEHDWKLELAIRLKKCRNFAEALRTLDQIPPDFPRQLETTLEKGECLQHLRRFSESLAAYEQAVARIRSGSAPTATERRALNRAGYLALEMGQYVAASRWLTELARAEPDNEDVRRRLDKLGEIRHKDGFATRANSGEQP